MVDVDEVRAALAAATSWPWYCVDDMPDPPDPAEGLGYWDPTCVYALKEPPDTIVFPPREPEWTDDDYHEAVSEAWSQAGGSCGSRQAATTRRPGRVKCRF